jgi:hypothetical protein
MIEPTNVHRIRCLNSLFSADIRGCLRRIGNICPEYELPTRAIRATNPQAAYYTSHTYDSMGTQPMCSNTKNVAQQLVRCRTPTYQPTQVHPRVVAGVARHSASVRKDMCTHQHHNVVTRCYMRFDHRFRPIATISHMRACYCTIDTDAVSGTKIRCLRVRMPHPEHNPLIDYTAMECIRVWLATHLNRSRKAESVRASG